MSKHPYLPSDVRYDVTTPRRTSDACITFVSTEEYQSLSRETREIAVAQFQQAERARQRAALRVRLGQSAVKVRVAY